MDKALFHRRVWDHYRRHKRDLPWRNTRDPYRILVSEIMLQQTQVNRVLKKYPSFLKAFPTVGPLARASNKAVLKEWQGMGYNRRALALKAIAETVVNQYGGHIPTSPDVLEKLPGIGKATARAVATFAFNTPHAFLETNVRSVYLHYFFPRRRAVADRELLPFVERTLDRRNPREWYFALMDYGVMLKENFVNPSRRSAVYRKQTPFRGSQRELRGKIVKSLVEKSGISARELAVHLKEKPSAVIHTLAILVREKLVYKRKGRFSV